MRVDTEALKRMKEQKGWSLAEMAQKMSLDYSFLYRVLHGQRRPGGKFLSGLMLLCRQEELEFEQFILLPASGQDFDNTLANRKK